MKAGAPARGSIEPSGSKNRVFELSVVTPDGPELTTRVRSLRLPGLDGSLGILPRHAPMVAALRCGILHVVHDDGESERIASGEGYAQVRRCGVQLILGFLDARPGIDQVRAHGAMRRALKRLEEPEDGVDLGRAEAALCRAFMRLKVCGCGCPLCRAAGERPGLDAGGGSM